ncbi:maleylpyruvate isomerase family mycothiol-dependent enzyme [Rhodococcus qingshengii]|uniref:maleylpyruvate isomerase family mycothiol-dependent enzyme n=1 Tax=Rhodococcus qingshengii TaxID=334542 RepID=UPI0036D951A9
MDVSTLHIVTENLAEWLSEITQGDLRHPTPFPGRDIGDLYLHLIDRNIVITAGLTHKATHQRVQPDPSRRSALDTPSNHYGGGFEELYRQTARQMEKAFASVTSAELRHRIGGVDLDAGTVYDKQISETVIHTWDLAQAMGFDYHPSPEIARSVLTTLQESPLDHADTAWECALKMSGRA